MLPILISVLERLIYLTFSKLPGNVHMLEPTTLEIRHIPLDRKCTGDEIPSGIAGS